MILPASYANGFAPRDGQPLYPQLWRGCVGAWNTCLGPTGLTLRDWSGLSRHATLTNIDPAAAWAPRSGRYAAILNGMNDSIDFTGLVQPLPFTLSFSIQPASFVSGDMRLFAYTSGGTVQFSTRLNGTSVEALNANGSEWNPVVTGLAPAINYISITATSIGAVGYLNGVQSASAAATGAIISARAFGAPFSVFGAFYAGSIWDVMMHNRVLTASEIRILASRRGIAYDLAPRRRSRIFTGGFKAIWAARKAQIIGVGV